jgi:hypothetical protein
MRTRTKIGVGVGVIVLVVVGALLFSLPSRQGRMVVINLFPAAKPAVTVSFVRYIGNGTGSLAILRITNRADSAVICGVSEDLRQEVREPGQIVYSMAREKLLPMDGHTDCQIEVSGIRLPGRVSMRCSTQPSKTRQRVQEFLLKAGIILLNTGSVATVDLPPRPATHSLGPTNQNAP